MLSDAIQGRYILSRPVIFHNVLQVTIALTIARSSPTRTFHPRLSLLLDNALGRSRYVGASDPAPIMGRGARRDPGTQPSGYSRHAGHRGRVREPADRWPDPELPSRVLSHYSGFPPMAAGAIGSVAEHGPGGFHGQYPGRAPPRRHGARHGGRLQSP